MDTALGHHAEGGREGGKYIQREERERRRRRKRGEIQKERGERGG